MTIGEIMRLTGRPKSSIYTHIRNVPLTPEQKKKIVEKHTARIVAFNRARKGISALGRHPKKFDSWGASSVSLVAHLLFDGEMNDRGSCVYTNSNHVLLEQVRVAMKEVYDFEPRHIESTPGVFRISYHNVELQAYLKQKAVQLLNEIMILEKELQRQFLKTFFDDEGSVYFIGARRAVRGYQHDYSLLMLIQTLLKNFGINSVIDQKYKEVTVTRKENLLRFQREIDFSAGLCINGKRTNSIWKESLEKREILRRAIASYRT